MIIAMTYYPHPHWRQISTMDDTGCIRAYDARRLPPTRLHEFRQMWQSLNPAHRLVTDDDSDFFDAIRRSEMFAQLST